MPDNKNEYCATERLYLNSAGKAVGAYSADRVSLLLVAGQCIPLDKAREYGLVADGISDPAPTPTPVEEDKEPQPIGGKPDQVEAVLEGGEPFAPEEAAEKGKKAAPQNKAVVSAPANKGRAKK